MANQIELIIELLQHATKKKDNRNEAIAKVLLRSEITEYCDIKNNCPFRELCYSEFAEEFEPEAPYNWRDDVD